MAVRCVFGEILATLTVILLKMMVYIMLESPFQKNPNYFISVISHITYNKGQNMIRYFFDCEY